MNILNLQENNLLQFYSINSLTNLLVNSLINSLVNSLINSLVNSLINSLVKPQINSLVKSVFIKFNVRPSFLRPSVCNNTLSIHYISDSIYFKYNIFLRKIVMALHCLYPTRMRWRLRH